MLSLLFSLLLLLSAFAAAVPLMLPVFALDAPLPTGCSQLP